MNNLMYCMLIAAACGLLSCSKKSTGPSQEDIQIAPSVVWLDAGEESDPDFVEDVRIMVYSSQLEAFWAQTIPFAERRFSFSDLPERSRLEISIEGLDSNGTVIYRGSTEVEDIRKDNHPVIIAKLQQPLAPMNLRAELVETNDIKLIWESRFARVDSFSVVRRLKNSLVYGKIGSSNKLRFRDRNASESSTYEYRVYAHNAAGTSGFSNPIMVWFSDTSGSVAIHVDTTVEGGASADSSEPIIIYIDTSRNIQTYVDTTGPVIVTLSHGSADTVFEETVRIFGTVVDPSGISEVHLNDVPVEMNGVIWEVGDLALQEGLNTVTVSAFDNSVEKNETTLDISLFYHVDAQGPVITLLSHRSTDTSSYRMATLFGTVEDQSGIAAFYLNDSLVVPDDAVWEWQGIYLEDGINTLELRAVDGSPDSNETSLSVTIFYNPLYVEVQNHPPKFTISASNLRGTLKAGQEYSKVLKAMDPDEHDLLWYSVAPPLELIDDTTAYWKPGLSDIGRHTVKAYVLDQDSARDSIGWVITVLDPKINTPPSFQTRVSQMKNKVSFGDIYRDTVRATDLDQTTGLIYEIIEGNCTIDPVSGAITWEPVKGDLGTSSHTVQVKDDSNATDELTWTIQVLDTSLASFSAGKDQTVSIKDTVYMNTTIQLRSGVITRYEWDFGNSGNFITVSDPDTFFQAPVFEALNYICVFRITLESGDIFDDELRVQVLRDVPTANGGNDQIVAAGDTVHLSGSGSDRYGTVELMEWDLGNTGNFVQGDSISFIAGENMGDYTCVFRVTDDDGNQRTDKVTIHVVSLPKSIQIPEGTYTMGSDQGAEDQGPSHEVRLKAFYMDSVEVTQREYKDIMGVMPSASKYRAGNPVESVTWFDAVLFCNARSKLYGLDTVYSYTGISGTTEAGVTGLANLAVDFSVKGYRLPTEAEWEYAARAGTATVYFWGNSPAEAGDYAVYNGNSGSTTGATASKSPNDFRIYDLAGNVWEWCNDWYDEYIGEVQENPTGPPTGVVKVIRGGSWKDEATELGSAVRQLGSPGWKSNFVGFRTVLPMQ